VLSPARHPHRHADFRSWKVRGSEAGADTVLCQERVRTQQRRRTAKGWFNSAAPSDVNREAKGMGEKFADDTKLGGVVETAAGCAAIQ